MNYHNKTSMSFYCNKHSNTAYLVLLSTGWIICFQYRWSHCFSLSSATPGRVCIHQGKDSALDNTHGTYLALKELKTGASASGNVAELVL